MIRFFRFRVWKSEREKMSFDRKWNKMDIEEEVLHLMVDICGVDSCLFTDVSEREFLEI